MKTRKYYPMVLALALLFTTVAGAGIVYCQLGPENMVLWNRLGSQAEIESSDVGLDGTILGGYFVEGVFGNAFAADFDQDYMVTFPKEVIPWDKGCLEFWAKISGFPASLSGGGAKPAFFQLRTSDSYCDYLVTLTGNDGGGDGGLCARVGHGFFTGTGYYTQPWTYEGVLGTGQVEDWHHYALVWDKDGIAGVEDGNKKVCVFLDGQMNSGRWYDYFGGNSEFIPLIDGELGLIFNQLSQGTVAVDNLKIWDSAKIDFSDRFVEGFFDASVSGVVTSDCPAPGSPLLGVTVDIYENEDGDIVGSDITDESGHYSIEDLTPGDYTVSVVTPLGHSATAEEIPVTLAGGDEAIIDFPLTCIAITAQPRGIGFWKHQVGVATGGNGHAHIDGPTLCGYLDLIEDHFNNNATNQVIVYEPPASGECLDKCLAAKDLLNLRGHQAMVVKARQQLMALLFNVAAQYISLNEVISEDGATVSQAITFCDSLIDDPEGDYEMAKDLAEMVNKGRTVPAGMIPEDSVVIAYRYGPGGIPQVVTLAQNTPNPFNPMTKISFTLPQEEMVNLAIYTVDGKRIATLVDEMAPAGRNEVVWMGANERGHRVASGTYFYRLKAGGYLQTKRMTFLK